MMKRVKRLTAALLAACLVVSLLPVGAGAVSPRSDGTTLIEMIDAAPDGGTITLAGNISVSNTGDIAPWTINKNITIDGQGHSIRVLSTGILLGGNVTFRNVEIDLVSTDSRNAIIANGYTLTLDNVKATNLAANIFCGTLLPASHESFAIPTPGTTHTVNIMGKTNLQGPATASLGTANIFAGSLAMGGLSPENNGEDANGEANTFSGDVTINIEDCADSSALGTVYAGGGQQRIPVNAQSGKITVPNPDKYKVDGTVTVSGAAIPTVDGRGSSATNVVYQGDGNQTTRTFGGISSLSVQSGYLVLQNGSEFQNGGAISVSSGAKLDLSRFNNPIQAFTGNGGILILGQNQTFTISGEATGSAKVAVGGTNSTNTASTSVVKRGHIYIKTPPSSSVKFELLPYANQTDMTLVKDDQGNWKVPEKEGEVSKLISLKPEAVHKVAAGVTEVTIPLKSAYTGESLGLETIPLTVHVNGQEAEFVPDNSYIDYYVADGLQLYVADWGHGDDEVVAYCADALNNPLPTGAYIIEITVPGEYTQSESDVSASFTLVVGDVTEDIPIAVPTANTGLKWNGAKQTGVNAGTGYTLTGVYEATNVGNYEATATLASGYQWKGGDTAAKTISWSIAKADGPSAPSNLLGIPPTAAGAKDGKITGTKAEMEYAANAEFNGAQNCTGTEITGLAPGTYYVRVKETATHEAGAYATVKVPEAGQPTAVPIPTANTGLKWTGKEQVGVPEGTGYTLTGNKATDAGSYTATAALASNYQWSDGSATPKTIPWTIAKGEAPAAPTGLKGIAPTSASGVNGKITGTETTMQYAAKADFTNAKDCAAGETTGLASGSYYVRFKETNNHPAGLAAEVTVPKYDGGGDSGSSGGGSTGGGDIQEPVTTPQQTANAINAANSGSTVTMTLPSGNTVSRTVWQALAGKDVTLEIETGRFTWSVDGRDVDSKALPTSLNLGAKEGMDLIPASVLEQTPRGTETLQISLNHNGAFAVPLTLSVDLGRDNAQRWANLYYYNTTAKTMEFQSASLIGDNGRAAFPMDHASSYAVVVDRVSHGSEGGDDPFLDVSLGAWYYDVVRYVYQKGLMTGTGRDTFSPLSPVTRGQAVTTLYRMAGSPAAQGAGSFRDVAAGSYYADAVAWAVEKGVATGHSADRFAPDAPITREQLAALLCRYARVVEGENVNVSAQVLLRFPDQGRVSAYAVQPMGWAVELGLIDGFQDGSLQPQGQANRAQLAAILSRFAER